MPKGTNLNRMRLQPVAGRTIHRPTVWSRTKKLGVDTVKSMKDTTGAGAAAQPSSESLGPNSEIGRKLKQLYDEVLSADVPERFSRLLADLERAEGGSKKD
jgi:hypothetical protein